MASLCVNFVAKNNKAEHLRGHKMLKHLQSIIKDFDCIPKRLEGIVCQYIMFLMLKSTKHDLRTASRVFGTHESNYSRLLSEPKTRQVARSCLNRAIRRRLTRVKTTDEIFLVIDATFTNRSGKKIQNKRKFRHGGKYFEGHQFTNFVLIINGDIVPLASVPLYSHDHCRELGIKYQSEIEIVTQWIEMLPESGLLPSAVMNRIHVLLDSGYDAKSIQNAINDIGLRFTDSILCERSVNGLPVKEYFKRYRHIPWRTIQVKTGSGVGQKIRKYRVRTAKKAHLKGFGEVTLFCSEKKSRIARKTSRKYFVTNDPRQSTRKAVINYSRRWAIEVWHKTMKQFYGYGDCRCKNFHAVEAHINFALCAYCINSLCEPQLPVEGTTLDQYQTALEWSKAAKVINLFGGREKIKNLAAVERQRVVNG